MTSSILHSARRRSPLVIAVAASCRGQAPAARRLRRRKAKPAKTMDRAAHALGRSGSAGRLERRHQHAAAAARRASGRSRCSTTRKRPNSRRQLANDLTRDRRDGGAEVDVNRAYNEHWMDARRLKITADHRTSLIVDPPDGRIPPLVPLSPERQKARAERAAASRAFQRRAAGRRRRNCRCRCAASSAPTRRRICRRSTTTIFRSSRVPATWSIAPEMIHSARIIPLDGRPHLGHESAPVAGRHARPLGRQHAGRRDDEFPNRRWRGVSGRQPRDLPHHRAIHRVDAEDTINYEFTIEDPTTWTKPWTAVIPWTKIDPGEQMYEYACHEDNYDIVHFLAGARARQTKGGTR